MRTIVALVAVLALLWGALFASGAGLLVWRTEPYAGTDYLARCVYLNAGGFSRSEHRFSTLADMQRFGCARWQAGR